MYFFSQIPTCTFVSDNYEQLIVYHQFYKNQQLNVIDNRKKLSVRQVVDNFSKIVSCRQLCGFTSEKGTAAEKLLLTYNFNSFLVVDNSSHKPCFSVVNDDKLLITNVCRQPNRLVCEGPSLQTFE